VFSFQLPVRQLTTDYVALPALSAARRAAARLLLTASRAAVDRYLLAPGPQQQTRSSGVRRPYGTDRRTVSSTLLRDAGSGNKERVILAHRSRIRILFF